MAPVKRRKSKIHQTNNCTQVFQCKIPAHRLHVTSFKQICSRYKCDILEKIEGNHFLCNREAPETGQIRKMMKIICQKIRIKKWKNITVLKMSVEKTNTQPRRTFKEVISMIAKNFGQLKKLDLNFDDWVEMDGASLEELAVQLGRKLVSLDYLELDFWKWDSISKRCLKIFGKEISQTLVHVKDLRIDFDGILFNSEKKNKVRKRLFCQMERYMINLACLSLAFRSDIIFKEIGELASQINRNAVAKLQTLTLCFTYQEASGENLYGLIQTLCIKLTHLKHLCLKITYWKPLNRTCLWFIFKEFSQHPVLESLKFNFYLHNEKRKENKTILFQPSKSLKKLDLTIDGKINSNQNLISLLSNRIAQNLGNLEHLKVVIDFGLSFKLNTQSIEALIFGVCSSLSHLKTLWIELNGESPEGNWQEESIYQTNKLRLSLRHLTLVFASRNEYTNDWLKTLGERIAFYLSDLVSLTLEFRFLSIHPTGLEMLGAIVSQSLIYLKSFTIVTPYSSEIKKSFQKMFNFVPNLEIKDRSNEF